MERWVKRYLEELAVKVRMGVIEATHAAKSGHPGGALSVTDMLTYLYFVDMRVNPHEPKAENRDRLVLSKGHSAPALYSTLALRGYFPKEDLMTLRRCGSYLQGHPNMNTVPGVDMSTGSLGQGLSCACGMALGAKHFGKDFRVYTIVGDGELQEGQIWEACMFASHYRLDNLCLIVDNNGLQIDGRISDVMSPYPIDKKLEAFGFSVTNIDGHDFDQIANALDEARNCKGKPTAIVMKTVKGKGVSFMENQAGWHGKAPNDEEYARAMMELKTRLQELEVTYDA